MLITDCATSLLLFLKNNNHSEENHIIYFVIHSNFSTKMQMELTPIRRFECMSRSRSSALPTVTEHRFLEHTGEWEGAGHRACAAREPEMRSHSDTVLFLFEVSRPLPLLVLLKTSGKGNSP